MNDDIKELLNIINYFFHFLGDSVKINDILKGYDDELASKYGNYSISEIFSLSKINSLYDDGLIDGKTKDNLIIWFNKYIKIQKKLMNIELYKVFDRNYNVDEDAVNSEYQLLSNMLSNYDLLDYNIINYDNSLLKVASNDLGLVSSNFVLFSYNSFFDVYLLLRDNWNEEILYILDAYLDYRDKYKEVREKDIKYFPINVVDARRIVDFVGNKLNLDIYVASFDISKSIREVIEEYNSLENKKKLSKVVRFPDKNKE